MTSPCCRFFLYKVPELVPVDVKFPLGEMNKIVGTIKNFKKIYSKNYSQFKRTVNLLMMPIQ